MLDFRERSRLRRMLYAKPTLIILTLITAGLLQASWSMYKKSEEALAKKEKAAWELEELKQREAELSRDIERLSTERGVEEEIRERFMVAKEGEKVIIVSEPEKQKTHSIIVSEEPSFVEKMKAAVGAE